MIFYCMNSNELSLGIHRFLQHFSFKKNNILVPNQTENDSSLCMN